MSHHFPGKNKKGTLNNVHCFGLVVWWGRVLGFKKNLGFT